MPSARAKSTSEISPDLDRSWSPPSVDEWLSLLRSATLARDIMRWSDGEMRASGIASDTASVQHLSDVFSGVLDELEAVANVVVEAERRLLVVATEETTAG